MKLTILIVVLYFSFCVARAPSPIYNTICKRVSVPTTCAQGYTWGFDERTRKCYPIPKNKEPCGFFDGEKRCKYFCLTPWG